MARGWESKSVEQQQDEASRGQPDSKPRPTAEQVTKQKQKNDLELSRRFILQRLENATNPRHRQMLEAALADLDAKLAQLK